MFDRCSLCVVRCVLVYMYVLLLVFCLSFVDCVFVACRVLFVVLVFGVWCYVFGGVVACCASGIVSCMPFVWVLCLLFVVWCLMLVALIPV